MKSLLPCSCGGCTTAEPVVVFVLFPMTRKNVKERLCEKKIGAQSVVAFVAKVEAGGRREPKRDRYTCRATRFTTLAGARRFAGAAVAACRSKRNTNCLSSEKLTPDPCVSVLGRRR